MRSPLWTSALLTLTTLLASCGGGGSPPTPTTTSTPATCDSTTLWAAHPSTSGSAIPDNNGTGISVNWDNQNCAVRTATAATLEICLSHGRTSDLVWTITPPERSSALQLTVPADWNASGASCDFGQGKFQSIDLLPTLSSNITPRGRWTLTVKDAALGEAGILRQWRLIIQGTP